MALHYFDDMKYFYMTQLVKILITLEPNGILGSNFCILLYFDIVQPLVCNTVTGVQSVMLVGKGILVKIHITLKPHRIF